jgi:hypothetical protein
MRQLSRQSSTARLGGGLRTRPTGALQSYSEAHGVTRRRKLAILSSGRPIEYSTHWSGGISEQGTGNKPKIHHRVHNNPPLVLVLSQMNTIHPVSFESALILSSHIVFSVRYELN